MGERFPKEQQLYQMISRCGHRNQNAVASDAANIMYNYQNQFTPQCIQVQDAGYTRQLLELKGEVNIQHRGNRYSIITSISFPFIYPDSPFVLRIFNVDPKRFCVNQRFLQGASPDQSVVNIHLSELASWNTHKNVAKVMTQFIQELSQNFPFYDKTVSAIPQQNNQYQQPYGNNTGFGYGGYNQYGNQNQNQPYGNQNQQYGNQNQYGNPQYQQQYNQQQQQQYGNQQYGNVNQGQSSQNLERDLRNKCIQILEPELSKISQNIKETKKASDKIVKVVEYQETMKRQLEAVSCNIDQHINYLQNDTQKMEQLLLENNAIELNETTAQNFVQESEQNSVLFDCLCEHQAIKESFHFICEKFRKTDCSFESLIKVTKQYSEQQFYCLLLQKKIQGQLR